MNGLTKQKNYHKQVTCGVCGKMRDDIMKRHTKTHSDINAMNEDDKRAELERRKEVHERREQQLQETQTIAIEIGAPAICYEQSAANSVTVHGDDLRTRLRNDKRAHAEKLNSVERLKRSLTMETRRKNRSRKKTRTHSICSKNKRC